MRLIYKYAMQINSPSRKKQPAEMKLFKLSIGYKSLVTVHNAEEKKSEC